MIPFDLSGTVRLPTSTRSNAATVKAIAAHLAAMLDEKECSEVLIEGNRVRFRNKWFGGTLRFSASDLDTFRSSFLSPFGAGTFDIEAAIDGITIRFSLSLARLWIGAAIFFAVFYVFALQHSGAERMLPLVIVAAFLVVQGAITWARVYFWLKRGLAGVNENSMNPGGKFR